jgi:uncharacterized protein (TIGR02001 family)
LFHLRFRNGSGSHVLLACLLLGAGPAARADVADWLRTLAPGGQVALTSDYIYRGVSESDGHGAVQGDLHLFAPDGTFLGAWASSRDADLEPGANALLELYIGHRFTLNSNWSADVTGRSRNYLGASSYEPSADYQEIAGTVTYLDSWSVSLTLIPNAVRYWFSTRLSREPAWVAATSGQWLLGRQLFLTAGAGYYRSQGSGPGIERSTGYGYGNAGIAWERGHLRADVGYFLTQEAAERSFPYPIAEHRFAGTVSWGF